MSSDARHGAPQSPYVVILDAENPWPGLASFDEQDAPFFHGRQEELAELERVVSRERLTLFFGRSGLGKTSLLRAGLFPRLRESNALPVYVRLQHTADTPQQPVPSLTAQTLAALAEEARRHGFEAPPHRPHDTLWEYFHRADAEFWTDRNRPAMPVLVFDQFEEIFVAQQGDRDDHARREQFLSELVDLIEGRPPPQVRSRIEADPTAARKFAFARHDYKVILSLREDYLADLDSRREFIRNTTQSRMRLLQMRGDQALEVVLRPGGRLVTPEVAERIVRFVAGVEDSSANTIDRSRDPVTGGDAVPQHDEVDRDEFPRLEVEPSLLSVICRELNKRRQQRAADQITAELLAGSRDDILSDFTDRCLADLPPEARRFVEDELVTVSGHRDSVALENALTRPGITQSAIDRLVDRRLLRIEQKGGMRRLELMHDVLTPVVRQQRVDRQLREEKERTIARQEAARRALNALAAADLLESQRRAGAGERGQAMAFVARSVRYNPLTGNSKAWLVDLLLYQQWAIPLAKPMKHDRAVRFAQFSPDGARIVTASDDGTARLWDAETGQPLGQPMKHERAVLTAQFSPDGTRVVTASLDGTARLWNADTGQPRSQPMKHTRGIRSAQFSPGGTLVVTASEDCTAKLWNAHTGAPFGAHLAHDGEVTSAHFSPEGSRVVTTSCDGTARLWSSRTGRCLADPMRHEGWVLSARFSPDGTRLATASYDGTARLWDSYKAQLLAEPIRRDDEISSVEFSPDGTRLVTASGDGAVRVWDARTGVPLARRMKHERAVRSAQFSPDSTRVVSASDDGTARLWDAYTGQPLTEPMRHGREVRMAQFSPDGTRVVTASFDGTARLWDARAGRPHTQTVKHELPVRSARFSPDGAWIITASEDGTARLWDVQTGRPVAVPMMHSDVVTTAEISPDGARVITASEDGTARLWDSRTGQSLAERMLHQSRVLAARFSRDGMRVVTASYDRSARLWNAYTGEPIAAPMIHERPVRSAEFSPDGTRVVTASYDRTARLWNACTGEPVADLMKHADVVISARFSPDGTRIVTASFDGSARLWDARTGWPLAEPMMHEGWVLSARFSPDGNRVVTASDDGTARIWDARTGRPLTERIKHERTIRSAQFSPDGTRIVTASFDGTTRLWDGLTGQPLSEPMRHRDVVTAAQFNPEGSRIVTASEGGLARLWDVPIPEIHDTTFLTDFAEALGGWRLTQSGILEQVDNCAARIDSLRALTRNAPPNQNTAASLVRWILDDPHTRTISPFSTVTVPEYIQRRLDEGTPEALREVLEAFPGHPLLKGREYPELEQGASAR